MEGVILAAVFFLVAGASATSKTPVKRNVIHIVVDDLRPELGCYGLPNRSTPNIDALAAGGTVFDRAFCNIGVCGPSRNSFMSGRRPAARSNSAVYATPQASATL